MHPTYPTYPSQPNTTYRLISHHLLSIGIPGDQEQQPFDARRGRENGRAEGVSGR